MKTVVTIADNQNVVVERFENELKVGERKIPFSVLAKSILDEVGFDYVLRYIVENAERLSDMLRNLRLPYQSKKDFNKFIELLLSNLDVTEIKDQYQELGLALLKQMQVTSDTDLLMESALLNYYDKKYALNENEQLIKLTAKLLRLLGNERNAQAQQQIIQSVLQLFNNLNDKEQLNEWYRFVLKNIEPALLLEQAHEIIKRNKGSMNYGFTTLPKHCVGVSMNDVGPVYILEVPKSQLRVRLQDVPYDAVGHPRLLFIIQYKKDIEKVLSIKCAAIKEHEPIHEEMELFKYPYSNVYGNGNVCWHGYPQDFNSIEMLPNLFLATANNTHLSSNVRQLFEYYQNRAFDDDKLEPMEKKLKNLY